MCVCVCVYILVYPRQHPVKRNVVAKIIKIGGEGEVSTAKKRDAT